MKTKNDFSVMSNKKCKCGQLIKQNMVDKNPDVQSCFNCYMKQVRKNPRYLIKNNYENF